MDHAIDIVIWRGAGPLGEVVDPIGLDEWGRASRDLRSFSRTDESSFTNPFTHELITLQVPGSGNWTRAEERLALTFRHGAIVVHRAQRGDAEAFLEIARRLHGKVEVVAVGGLTPFAARRSRLADALRSALASWPREARLFLPAGPLQPASECLVLEGDAPETLPTTAGFPAEAPEITPIALSAAHVSNPPSDELLVRALVHYLEHDAFLDERLAPGATLSPARRFYDELGDERTDVPCKSPGCSRGAIVSGVFCKSHHFEMIRRTPGPFEP